jgi:two-component system, cell cycle response regulator DivK
VFFGFTDRQICASFLFFLRSHIQWHTVHSREMEKRGSLGILSTTGLFFCTDQLAERAVLPQRNSARRVAENIPGETQERKLKTALVVEDNVVNRELLRELLCARDYLVEEAENGVQALEMMKQRRPDVLLLDLNMPVLDGFGTLRKVREDPQLSSIPVLAVTASAMRGDEEEALKAGFDGYLSKPIQSPLLFQELDRLLKNG